MAVLKKEDLLLALKAKIGEDTDDETLKFIEDVTDTITDYETRVKDTTDWEQKYKDNDSEWRKKYKERFFSGEKAEEDGDKPAEKEEKILSYDELFKEEK